MITHNGSSWESYICPNCGTHNWVCHGNLDDFTQPDRDGCKCFHCAHKWLFTTYDNDIIDYEPYYELGESKLPF